MLAFCAMESNWSSCMPRPKHANAQFCNASTVWNFIVLWSWIRLLSKTFQEYVSVIFFVIILKITLKYNFSLAAAAVPIKTKKTDLPIIPPESEILPSLDDSDDFAESISDDDDDSSDQDEMIADEPLDAVITEDAAGELSDTYQCIQYSSFISWR